MELHLVLRNKTLGSNPRRRILVERNLMLKAPKTSNFRLCRNRGFQITFENGYTVSVQFGAGNYCDNQSDALRKPTDIKSAADLECGNAEVAILDQNNNFIGFASTGGENVLTHITPEKVAEIIAWACRQKPISSII